MHQPVVIAWSFCVLLTGVQCLASPLPHVTPSPAEVVVRDTTYFQAKTGYRFQIFQDSEPPWQKYSAEAGYHHYEYGSLYFAYHRASRFDEWDDLLVLQTYPQLGSNRYAHVRMQYVLEPSVFPAQEYQLEYFHPVSQNWLAFASTRLRHYPALDTYSFGAGLDAYYRSWFVRGHLQTAWLKGEMGGSMSVLMRRYVCPGDCYVEGRVGYGREPIIIAPGPVVEIGSSYSATLGGQYFLSTHWGLSVVGTLIKSAALPLRTGLLLQLLHRW